jgi:hypothetical protein
MGLVDFLDSSNARLGFGRFLRSSILPKCGDGGGDE